MPIIEASITITDEDLGYNELVRNLSQGISHVDIGIHSVSGEELVTVATANEFGASIDHPGGQPFIIVNERNHPKGESRDDRSKYVPLEGGGELVFLKKGKKGMGVTKPHHIEIPARPFIRSTIDENRNNYEEQAKRQWGAVLDNQKDVQQALGVMGQLIEGDVKLKIVNLKTPPNAPETIRRKGSANPLVDSSTMLNSIRYAIKKEDGEIVEMSDEGTM